MGLVTFLKQFPHLNLEREKIENTKPNIVFRIKNKTQFNLKYVNIRESLCRPSFTIIITIKINWRDLYFKGKVTVI